MLCKKLILLLVFFGLARLADAAEPTTGVQLGDTLIPTGPSFPSHIANKGYGGWHVGTNQADISESFRPIGTAAWNTDSEELYTWDGTSWKLFSPGASTNDISALEADIGVLEGRSNAWNTAYGWGDHSTNGYITTDATVTNSLALGGTLAAEYLLRDGSVALTGDLNLGGQSLTNLAAPVQDTDGANKVYVDDAVNDSLVRTFVVSTNNFSIATTNEMVLIDAHEATLPAAADMTGLKLTIKATADGASVLTTGSELLDGSDYDTGAGFALAENEFITMISNGTRWYIVASNLIVYQ